MLMRTDPFRELDRVAQQVFGTAARPAVMPMDAYRDGETFVAHFDLPGVRSESIDLQVERNVLTIRAERTAVNSGPDEKRELVVAERPAGVFTRQLFLGETLDTEHIAADYTDGVLTLRIPVAEKAKPKRISVSSGSTSKQIDA